MNQPSIEGLKKQPTNPPTTPPPSFIPTSGSAIDLDITPADSAFAPVTALAPDTALTAATISAHGTGLQFDRRPIVIFSNRQLAEFQLDAEGKWLAKVAAGGLATALSSILGPNVLAVSWDVPSEGMLSLREACDAIREGLFQPPFAVRGVAMTEPERHGYYDVVSNGDLWPVYHAMLAYVIGASEESWTVFREIAQRFVDQVRSGLPPDARVLVHDYHLMLAPELLRALFPELAIHYFHHIPWPEYQYYRCELSEQHQHELIDGILGADLIGLQTITDVRNFIECATALDYECTFDEEHRVATVIAQDGRTVTIKPFPISVDYDRIRRMIAQDPEVAQGESFLRDKFAHLGEDHRLFVGVERLDYTKGLAERFEAVRVLLQDHPELREKFTLAQYAAPNRDTVPAYPELAGHLRVLVDSINQEFGTDRWKPIHFQITKTPYAKVIGYFRAADVALVTPIRDGMNLVAKEAIVANDSGKILILGRGAGASAELGNEALLVDGSKFVEIAEAMWQATVMLKDEPQEIQRRWEVMYDQIKNHPVQAWQREVLDALDQAVALRWNARRQNYPTDGTTAFGLRGPTDQFGAHP